VIFREKIKIDQLFTGYASRMISHFRRLFSKSSISSLFVIGLLNGLLPCGLVYVAIAGAISSGEILSGIFYMVLFGLGTIPVMFSIPLAGQLIGNSIRKRFRGVVSVFIVILGILFILRGMSLGIPFISPPTKMLKPHEKQMMHKNNNVKHSDSLILHQ
jgi:sulfite exporter TauE/SafE